MIRHNLVMKHILCDRGLLSSIVCSSFVEHSLFSTREKYLKTFWFPTRWLDWVMNFFSLLHYFCSKKSEQSARKQALWSFTLLHWGLFRIGHLAHYVVTGWSMGSSIFANCKPVAVSKQSTCTAVYETVKEEIAHRKKETIKWNHHCSYYNHQSFEKTLMQS